MLKRKKDAKNIINVFALLIVLVILFLTIGYSAFQSSGIISDITATVRPDMNIKITDVQIEGTSEAIVVSKDYNTINSNNNTYTGKLISDLTFTNTNSSVTYKVEVTNFGNTEMGISSISGLPNNLTYELDTNTYDIGEKICDSTNTSKCTLGAKKSIYITIKYKSGSGTNTNTNLSLNLDLTFKEIHNIYYGGNAIGYVIDGGNKTVSLGSNAPDYIQVAGTYSSHSYTNPNVTINGVTSDITIEEIHKIYLDNNELDTVVHGGNKTVPLGTSAPASETNIQITGTYSSKSYTKPNLTLNGVTSDIYITISSSSGGGGSWSEPEEDNTTTVYDPENIPPNSTIVYNAVDGAPQVSTDEDGNITRFEYTNTGDNGITSPSGGLDTGVLAFDGRDFTVTLKATFTFANCKVSICPIINASQKKSTVNGVLVYEMGNQNSGYGHTSSGSNVSTPYNKFRYGKYENSKSSGNVDYNISNRINNSQSSSRYGYNSSSSPVTLTIKLYYTAGTFTTEIYNENGTLLAKPYNNTSYSFSNISDNLEDVTIEIGHYDGFGEGVVYTHTFDILEFSVVKL